MNQKLKPFKVSITSCVSCKNRFECKKKIKDVVNNGCLTYKNEDLY